jgi:hypothetical protein
MGAAFVVRGGTREQAVLVRQEGFEPPTLSSED